VPALNGIEGQVKPADVAAVERIEGGPFFLLVVLNGGFGRKDTATP
jgi:hypothetical protein